MAKSKEGFFSWEKFYEDFAVQGGFYEFKYKNMEIIVGLFEKKGH